MLGSIREHVPVVFFCILSSMYVISLNMFIFTCYTFVYMYVHALMPLACGLTFICNKVLFCFDWAPPYT